MERFRMFHRKVIEMEGYTATNPSSSDGSNITFWGLDSQFQPKAVKRHILNGTLSKEGAEAVAFVNYYLPIVGIYEMPAPIAFVIYDMRFHGWNRIVFKKLQRLVSEYTGIQLRIDGRHGPSTYAAIMQLSPVEVESVIRRLSASFEEDADKMSHSSSVKKRFGNVEAGFRNRYRKRYSIAAAFSHVPVDTRPYVAKAPQIRVSVLPRKV